MDFVKEKVSGKRNRLRTDEFNLDLTYITPRILAMSLPGTTFIQKMYRNNISEVGEYLNTKHTNKYRVYNLTGIEYNAEPLNNNVLTYSWEDHHSPTLHLLFKICQNMHQFLQEDEENVAVIHCNAGKGRTGTLICCYLLFCKFADTAQNAITYYGWKRF